MARPSGNLSVNTGDAIGAKITRAIVVEGGDQLKELVGGTIGTEGSTVGASWPTDGTNGKGYLVTDGSAGHVEFGDLASLGGNSAESIIVFGESSDADAAGTRYLVNKQGGGDDYCGIVRAANESYSGGIGVGSDFGFSSATVDSWTSAPFLCGVFWDGSNQYARFNGNKGSNSAKTGTSNDTTQTLYLNNSSDTNAGSTATVWFWLFLDEDVTDAQWTALQSDPWKWAQGADSTAPTYSVNPAQDTITDTSVTIDATAADETDATVSHYAVVVADGATAPSGAQVAAGQDSTGSAAIASGNDTGVSNGAEGSIVMSGLTASTAYDVYHIVQDSTPNRSTPFLVNITTLVAANRGLRIPCKNTSGSNYPNTTGITVVVYASVGGAESFETATASITSGVMEIDDDAVGALGAKVYVVGHKDGASDADDIGFQGEVTVVDLNTADNSV